MTADTSNIRTSFQQFTTPGERRVARNLIRAALAEGWQISVNDGEETTVHRATRLATVTDALATTDEDYITIHLPVRGKSGGTFQLVWGNEEDGSCLIADHTDNENCARLYAAAYA